MGARCFPLTVKYLDNVESNTFDGPLVRIMKDLGKQFGKVNVARAPSAQLVKQQQHLAVHLARAVGKPGVAGLLLLLLLMMLLLLLLLLYFLMPVCTLPSDEKW